MRAATRASARRAGAPRAVVKCFCAADLTRPGLPRHSAPIVVGDARADRAALPPIRIERNHEGRRDAIRRTHDRPSDPRRARRRAPAAPPRWTVDARRGAVRAAVQRSPVPRAAGAPRASRAERRAAVDAALDQDRRLPRGLRLLPAGGALPHRRRRTRRCSTSPTVVAAARAAKAAGRDALLHGRRVARPEGARPRAGARRWCAR